MRCLIFALLLSLSAPAWATEPAEPWQDRYQVAMTLAHRGRFIEARDRLEVLAAEPSATPTQRASVAAVLRLLRGWVAEGYRLGRPASHAYGRTRGELGRLYIDSLWYGLGTGLMIAQHTEPDSSAGLLLPMLGLSAVSAWLAERDAPSADRALFLDLGGIAGTLAAGGLYLAFADKHTERQSMLLTTAVGMATGLGLAWGLTVGLPPDPPRRQRGRKVSLQLLPLEGGGMLGAMGTFSSQAHK